MNEVRGRFAPSPTGFLHLGNLWCALLAWLSAKAAGGALVLRMEDLDPGRCRADYAARLLDDLCWLGLSWDEGPDVGGPAGPYTQSACGELYAAALERLGRRAALYPCYCTRADLHAAGAPHLSDGTVVYSGRCRGLSPAQRAAREAAGRKGALRIAVPDETICFTDRLLGPQRQNLAAACGDFILRRTDGVYAYQLAVVVDDGRMGITQVVRGRDLASSTARQLYLQRLLGLPQPEYYHVPMLVNPAGQRLSKREQSLGVSALRGRCTARELCGELAALAGLADTPAPVRPAELLEVFSWDKVPRGDITVPARLF